jgi:Domain of unknown function (DUF4832)/Beta-galactosidase
MLFSAIVLNVISCAVGAEPLPAKPPPVLPAPPKPPDTIVVRPAEIDDVLVNPGMGVQTFQRFDGQALNSGLEWSEEGPTAPIADPPTRPDAPPSSIAYCRWFWETIEPEQGKIRWDIIDSAIAAARAHHQALAIRLMPYDPNHPLPAWYRRSGARRANKPSDRDGRLWQPDFTDPLYRKHWGALVAAAGARYDGHPNIDTVDISSVGYWGEGWSDYMPDLDDQKALIDIWLKAFPHTTLLMNFDEPDALAYGVAHGAGYRLDCLGDARTGPHGEPVWSHMWNLYPQQIVRAGIQDAWTRRPVSMESCWVPGYWKQHGFDVDAILSQALRWHITSINLKSSAIPAEWKARFEAFQKKAGYRFILRQISYPRAVARGRMMPVHMWWFNAGVAPVYREYTLALELRSPGGAATIRVPIDVRTFLPNDALFDGTLYVPETLEPGVYRVRVAMLDPRTQMPAIRLAIAGRQPDGWYDLGEIQVEGG